MARYAPYSRRFLAERPGAGLVVAIGPGAWDVARRWGYPVVVLPPGDDPAGYRWPAHRYGAVLHEAGPADDGLLTATAAALLRAGNPVVVAVRWSLFGSGADSRHFFYPEEAADGVVS